MPKALDMEALKQKDSLSEDELAQIADEAYEESDSEKEGKKKDEEEEEEKQEQEEGKKKEEEEEGEEEDKPKSDDELIKAPDEELNDEEKTKKKELLETRKVEEEKRLLDAKEEDLSDEDKSKRTELIKEREEAEKKALDEKVKAYAEEHEVSEDEARQDLETISKTYKETFKENPEALAKSYLHLQRLQARTENQLKKVQQAMQTAQELTPDRVISDIIDKGQIKVKGKSASREDIIESYREQNPDITENASDDAVLKMAAREIKTALDKQGESRRADLSKQAKEKRTSLIGNLSEGDKQFLPEIKSMINNLSDAQIAADDFSLQPYINYAKGKKYDKAMKEAEERGFKRGQEEAKIIAEKSKKGGPADGSPKPKQKGGLKRDLTAREKDRALTMYENLDAPDEEKFKMYIELYTKKDEEFKDD